MRWRWMGSERPCDGKVLGATRPQCDNAGRQGRSGGETEQDMTTRHIAWMAAAILLAVSTAEAAIINVPGDEPTIQW